MDLIWNGAWRQRGGAVGPLIWAGKVYTPAAPVGGIDALLVRSAAEALGSAPAELALRRALAEAIHATVPTQIGLGRTVAEVLAALPPTYITLERHIVESIGLVPFAPPVIGATLDRNLLEVVGYAGEYLGNYTTVGRSALEVVSSAGILMRGWDLPAIPVQQTTIALFLTLDFSAGSGTWGIRDGNGHGLTISWVGTEPMNLKIRWVDDAGEQILDQLPSSGLTLLFLRAGSTGSPVSLADMGQYRDDGAENSLILHEAMIWDRHLTSDEEATVTGYLANKWYPL